ncbi:uncharacterized protein LOC118343100 [Morone saxatilis]|uniref:uncharacterized protein LOC118343100 n=1 Tax=Morone saxatilis TaxID=34816 RepID=UPI0015E2231D|nr:uncharacterized protein LOC118343100 [Morone saxatilis]
MESRAEEQEEDASRSPSADKDTTTKTTDTASAVNSTLAATTETTDGQTEEEETGEVVRGNCVAMETPGVMSSVCLPAGDRGQEGDFQPAAVEDEFVSEQKSSTPTEKPAPPSSLALSGSRPTKKKVLLAPALSLSLVSTEGNPKRKRKRRRGTTVAINKRNQSDPEKQSDQHLNPLHVIVRSHASSDSVEPVNKQRNYRNQHTPLKQSQTLTDHYRPPHRPSTDHYQTSSETIKQTLPQTAHREIARITGPSPQTITDPHSFLL